MRKFALGAVVAGPVLLSGCGGAPTDDDVRAALSAQMQAFGGKQAADMMKADLSKIKLLGCKASDAGGHRCDWSGPMGGGTGRFVKGDGGWVLVPGG